MLEINSKVCLLSDIDYIYSYFLTFIEKRNNNIIDRLTSIIKTYDVPYYIINNIEKDVDDTIIYIIYDKYTLKYIRVNEKQIILYDNFKKMLKFFKKRLIMYKLKEN